MHATTLCYNYASREKIKSSKTIATFNTQVCCVAAKN